MRIKHLSVTGDTIVEVLIAIVIASTVLTGAFISAQHSLTGTRQSQERIEALKVGEEQLEKLREMAAVTGNTFTNGGITLSCIDSASPPVQQIVSTIYSTSSEVFSDTGAHPTACDRNVTAGYRYYPVIQRTAVTGGYTFTIYIHWERAGGGGNEEVKLSYRVYT